MSDARHFGISSSRQLHRHSPPLLTPWIIVIRNMLILLALSSAAALLLYCLGTARPF